MLPGTARERVSADITIRLRKLNGPSCNGFSKGAIECAMVDMISLLFGRILEGHCTTISPLNMVCRAVEYIGRCISKCRISSGPRACDKSTVERFGLYSSTSAR